MNCRRDDYPPHDDEPCCNGRTCPRCREGRPPVLGVAILGSALFYLVVGLALFR